MRETSAEYWVRRYAMGGASGRGSVGAEAEDKARAINDVVRQTGTQSVLDLGCGDGSQLRLLSLPHYVGVDVSPDALARARVVLASRRGELCLAAAVPPKLRVDLAMSVDVVFHLCETDVFRQYFRDLFGCALHHVLIYSTNVDRKSSPREPHVRHREFTRWVALKFPAWTLTAGPFAERLRPPAPPKAFYLYERLPT